MTLFDIKLKKNETVEKLWMWIAWRLPHTLVMWAAIRLIAFATQGKYGNTIVPELTAMDAVKRWPMPSTRR